MEMRLREDSGYSGVAIVWGAFLTVFLPPAALAAALLSLRGESDARRRAQLRLWAWLSTLWLALVVAAVLLALS